MVLKNIIPILMLGSISLAANAFIVDYEDKSTLKKMNDPSEVFKKFKTHDNKKLDLSSESSEDSTTSISSLVDGGSIQGKSAVIDKTFVLENESSSSGACIKGVNDGAIRLNGGVLEQCNNGTWNKTESLSSGGESCAYEISEIKKHWTNDTLTLKNTKPNYDKITFTVKPYHPHGKGYVYNIANGHDFPFTSSSVIGMCGSTQNLVYKYKCLSGNMSRYVDEIVKGSYVDCSGG